MADDLAHAIARVRRASADDSRGRAIGMGSANSGLALVIPARRLRTLARLVAESAFAQGRQDIGRRLHMSRSQPSSALTTLDLWSSPISIAASSDGATRKNCR